jgi:hypothetical protein
MTKVFLNYWPEAIHQIVTLTNRYCMRCSTSCILQFIYKRRDPTMIKRTTREKAHATKFQMKKKLEPKKLNSNDLKFFAV